MKRKKLNRSKSRKSFSRGTHPNKRNATSGTQRGGIRF